jgi:hypothetical protein
MTNLKEEILEAFDEKSIFAGAGLLSPHPKDLRLDALNIAKVRKFLESTIDKAYTQGAKDAIEAVKIRKQRKPLCDIKDSEYDIAISQITYRNQSIDEIAQLAKQFIEKL